MSTSLTGPNFSLSGLASGLDTNSMIQALIAADSQPKLQLQYKVAALQAQNTGLTAIQTQLGALKDAANALSSVSSWLPTQTVSSSAASQVSAVTTGGVGPGGYQVSVTRLARAEQHTFTYTAPAADTTLDVTAGGTTTSINVAAGADAQTVADQLNGVSDGPVFAVVVNGSLVLSSRTSGSAGSFTVSSSALSNETVSAGQDAQYSVDGGAVQTSSSNVVHNGIPGLDLTLSAVTASPVTITVSNPTVDQDGLASKIQTFVDTYNKTIDMINSDLDEAKVNNPQNTTDAAKGALHDDSSLQDLLISLRGTLSQTYGSNGNFDLLSQIGISTGATTGDGTPSADAIAGHLTFDKDTFTSAMSTNPADVKTILGASGGAGFAQAITTYLAPQLDTGAGLDLREQQIQSDISDYNQQISDMDAALQLKQQRYQEQFTAMETALSSAQSQQSWLASQIAGLPHG